MCTLLGAVITTVDTVDMVTADDACTAEMTSALGVAMAAEGVAVDGMDVATGEVGCCVVNPCKREDRVVAEEDTVGVVWSDNVGVVWRDATEVRTVDNEIWDEEEDEEEDEEVIWCVVLGRSAGGKV